MIKKIFFLFLILYFLFSPSSVLANEKFLTLVYPVRGRNLWVDKELFRLDEIFSELNKYNFKSTWLLQYDALSDRALVAKIKKDCPNCEFGVFIEVSEDFATQANVSYKIGEGNWARPDKTFFSGYRLIERERLIDTVFKRFNDIFGYYPVTIGAWYIDPYTLNYLQKYSSVITHVSLADQYNTDGQRYWGKYYGLPFYSQKYDIMVPANQKENKLDIVQIQWAQRHPTLSYGNGVWYSQHSLQANDYKNNKKDTSVFKEISGYYLDNFQNPFGQITVGLEVGQELVTFFVEHQKQLEYLSSLKELKVLTTSEFGNWYKKEYPNFSPTTYITDGQTLWTSSVLSRIGESKNSVFDTRKYSSPSYSFDAWQVDDKTFLNREVAKNDKRSLASIRMSILIARIKDQIHDIFGFFVKTKIDNKLVVGFRFGKENVVGLWQNRGFGFYSFPFQTLAKFQTLGDLLIR